MEAQVLSIFAATPREDRASWIRRYEVSDVPRYETEMLEYVRAHHPEVLDTIRTTGKLEEDSERKLIAALDEFANVFQPTPGLAQASEVEAA